MDRRLLRALFGPGGRLSLEADLTDADLLARFAERADGHDAAFAEIVRRHGPLVWAVCRGSLADPADAEDAFQATFLALVRSPRSVRRDGSLPGWLHGVAVRVAAGVRRTAGRRKQREARAAVPEGHSPVPDSAWGEVYAAVQAEVARLPAGLRAAFVLCEIGRVPHAEAAQQLGWKPGTLTGTLARAKRRLIARLAERGIAPAALVGIGAASGPAAAVPWKMIEAVSVFPNAAAGTVPVALVQLATEGLAMGVSHVKLLAAAAVIAGGLTFSVGPAALPSADAQGFGRAGGGGGASQPPAEAKPADAPPPAAAMGFGAGGVMRRPEPAATWEYLYADMPGDNAEFKKTLESLSPRGWEYAGPTVTVSGMGMGSERAKLVFKRPAPTPPLAVTRADLPARAGGFSGTAAPAGMPDEAARRMQAEIERLVQEMARRFQDQNRLPAPLPATSALPPLPAGGGAPLPAGARRATVYDADPLTIAKLKDEVDRLRSELERLKTATERSSAPAPVQTVPLERMSVPPPPVPLERMSVPATPRPAAAPRPAVFEVPIVSTGDEAVKLAAELVPVVEAGLDRESAKVGGPVRVVAFGQQLLIFGGTPQTAERVAQLTASLGIKLTAVKPKTTTK